MEFIVAIALPLGICVALPVLIVWLVTRARQNEVNRKTEIMLKAIEAGTAVDTSFFKSLQDQKTIKERLLNRLSAACVVSLIGIPILVIGIMLCKTYGLQGDTVFVPMIGGILLTIGIGLLIVYFVGKKLLAKEIEAEEQESLRRFLLALCGGDASLADDIAQEALLRAYVASGSFRYRSKFSTWLFRIAYNCYIDNLRKSMPETVSADTSQAMNAPAPDESDGRFRYQNLYQALECLKEKEKAVIALHYFEERSIKEIAAILQIPAGTVKYYLSTGRNHLKSILK